MGSGERPSPVSETQFVHLQPTRLPRPWDSPGNTGVGCHFLLQCMKVKSESEVAQPTLRDPMDCSLPGSSTMGFSRQVYWSGVPLPSLDRDTEPLLNDGPRHTVLGGKAGLGVLCCRAPPPQATEAAEETRRGSCTPPCRARVTQGPSVASISDWLYVCHVLGKEREAALTGQGRMATVSPVSPGAWGSGREGQWGRTPVGFFLRIQVAKQECVCLCAQSSLTLLPQGLYAACQPPLFMGFSQARIQDSEMLTGVVEGEGSPHHRHHH